MDARESCRGNATIVAVLALLAIAGFAGTVLSVSRTSSGETRAAAERNRAFFAAEFGANAALAELGAAPGAAGGPGKMGTAAEPIELSGGSYWIEVEPLGGGYQRLLSHGRAGLHERTLEVVFLDDRLETGQPSRRTDEGRGMDVLSWREVGRD